MTSHTKFHLKPMMSFGKRNVLTILRLLLAKLTKNKSMEYQCPDCPYVYNEEEGDPDNGIAPGTKFEALPDTWMCPVCEAEKMRFANQK